MVPASHLKLSVRSSSRREDRSTFSIEETKGLIHYKFAVAVAMQNEDRSTPNMSSRVFRARWARESTKDPE